MKLSGILFLLLSFTSTFSQKQGISFPSLTFDYGDVQQWDNPPATFAFTNTTAKEILFLPTFKRDDIYAELPKGKIKTGESGTVLIYIFTSATGEFQKSIDLYTNASNVPVKLTVKGNILSLDPSAFISCPGFAPKVDRTDDLALLLDSISAPTKNKTQNPDSMTFEKVDEPASKPIQRVYDRVLPENEYAANNIVFLIDVSSSMNKPNKLPLLKTSMKNLANVLRRVDYISMITYSTTSTVMLNPTVATNRAEIISLIDTLTTGGRTNGVKGLQNAYEIAEKNLIQGGNNQVVIATDGLFNSPDFSESDLYAMVKQKAKQGVKLSVVGFGHDEDALKMMHKMAEKGSGSFIQIPNIQSANEILIEEIKSQSVFIKQ